jgi:putative heme-binding domain-containing protein
VKEGNPVAGEKIFRRRKLACFSCHAIGPIGSQIGPNLVAVGAAAQTDYIIEAILQPNKTIAQHYENQLITLADGTIRMGAITYKGEKDIIIRDSAQTGREIRISTASIKTIKPMPSLMPPGLVDQLQTRQEFLDLARFVSLLGRPGPYANNESPVIRKWQITPGIANELPAGKASWLPVYSMVNGHLPDSDLGKESLAYARGFVQVQVAGRVDLLLNDATGLQLWIDGQRIAGLDSPVDLTEGRHSLTFAIRRDLRKGKGLRVELSTPANSSARFQPEGGL